MAVAMSANVSVISQVTHVDTAGVVVGALTLFVSINKAK